MPGCPSLCRRCHEAMPEGAAAATMMSCPRCGEPRPQPEPGAISAGGLNAWKPRRMLSTAMVGTVCLAVVAGAGALIYQKVSGLSSSRALAVKAVAAPAVASTKAEVDKTRDEGPAWSHTPLFVVRPARAPMRGRLSFWAILSE